MTSVRVGSRRNEYLEAALEEKPVPNGGRAAGRVRENNAIRTCAPPPAVPPKLPRTSFPARGAAGSRAAATDEGPNHLGLPHQNLTCAVCK